MKSTSASLAVDAQCGAALTIVLLGMSALLSLGLGLVSLTTTETAIAGYQEASLRAFYGADAAAEYVVRELLEAPTWDQVLDGTHRSLWNDDVPVDVTDETAIVQAETWSSLASGVDPPVWRPYARGRLSTILGGDPTAALISIVVWVADDGAERDGTPVADSNGVITLLARAFGTHGTRRSIVVSLARVPADGMAPDGGDESHDDGEADEESTSMTTHVRSWRELR